MLTRLTKILFLCSLLLFIGAGCSKEKEPTDDSPQVVDNEAVIESTDAQKAYAFCFSQGLEVKLVYDEQKGRGIVCVLPDGTECPAISYMNGECLADTPSLAVDVGTGPISPLPDRPRSCDPTAPAVCGDDNRTYANECVAEQHDVSIQLEGPCPPDLEPIDPSAYKSGEQKTVIRNQNTGQGVPLSKYMAPNIIAEKGLSEGATTGGGTDPKAPGQNIPKEGTAEQIPEGPTQTTEGIPEWLEIPISLMQEDASTANAFFYRCRDGNTTYYLQSIDCPDCYKTLYTQTGSVLCYPTNDLDGSCPAGFEANSNPASCQVVWSKDS